MFLVGFLAQKKYKELEKKCPRAPGSTQNNSRKNLSQIELEGRAWKCLRPITKKYSGRYCTILYCTAVLYKYHALVVTSSTTSRGSCWSSAAVQRLHGTHTLHRRHIITRSDLIRRVHWRHEVDLVRLRMMWTAPTSTSSISSRVGPGAVWATASTSPSNPRSIWWTAAKSTSETIWTVQDMSKNLIVTCARILRTR